MLHHENQPNSLAPFRPGETRGDCINTTLENWDPQSDWYVCKSQQQRLTGFSLAPFKRNEGDS